MTVAISLLGSSQLGSAATTVYAASAGSAARIDKATFCNTTGAAATLTVYIVPPGGAPGAGTTIVSAVNVGANSTYVSPELPGHVLGPGYSLQALSSVANAITALVSGTVVS